MKPATALLVALLVAAAVGAVPTGSANHGSSANYTVEPVDHSPGATGVSYKQFAVADTHVENIDYLVGRFSAGSFGSCGSTNSETFGIDRDDDARGTQTDEDLRPHVESARTTEHTFIADMYDSDDPVGTTTHIDVGDQFVSHTTDCFENPDEPGWYQMYSKINGTTDGEHIRNDGSSHYFYICECDSEAEARERLGPPPGEEASRTQTPTPSPSRTATTEPTPTRTPPAEGTPFPSPTPTPSPDATPVATGTGTGRPTAGEPAGDGGGATPDATATPESWDDYYPKTPTVARAPGFGPGLALAAVLGAVLLGLRRS